MTSYEIITPAGVTVRTFSCVEMARKFVLKHKADLPGLGIDEVEVIVSRRRLYRPRMSVAA